MSRGVSFSVHSRDEGHWDISDASGRRFRIRGDQAQGFIVFDERFKPGEKITFGSVPAAMSFICDRLMEK